MRTPEFRETEKKLAEAERMGNAVLRRVAADVLETCGSDSGLLEALARLSEEKAYSAEDEELSGTWMFLRDQVWDCARRCLSREDYHRFFESLKNGIRL